MSARPYILAASLAGFLVCSVAGAQTRGGATRMSGGHMGSAARGSVPVSRSGSTVFRSGQQASVIQISPSGRITTGFSPFNNSLNFRSEFGVPGLGFDFPHLAAISGALSNSSSFGFRRHHHFGETGFVPFLFDGFPSYYDYGDMNYEQPEQSAQTPAQPQIIVIQQPVPAQTGASSGNGAENYSAAPPAPEAEQPVRDVGEFVLVRRDGRVLFASMFMVAGTQVRYVTPEGIRRTIALADLDADATKQLNEARGTTIQLNN